MAVRVGLTSSGDTFRERRFTLVRSIKTDAITADKRSRLLTIRGLTENIKPKITTVRKAIPMRFLSLFLISLIVLESDYLLKSPTVWKIRLCLKIFLNRSINLSVGGSGGSIWVSSVLSRLLRMSLSSNLAGGILF